MICQRHLLVANVKRVSFWGDGVVFFFPSQANPHLGAGWWAGGGGGGSGSKQRQSSILAFFRTASPEAGVDEIAT